MAVAASANLPFQAEAMIANLSPTFRDWTSEHTNFPRDMAEMALAHFIGSEVERAYRRGDMLEKRREMMATWAGFFLAGGSTEGNDATNQAQ